MSVSVNTRLDSKHDICLNTLVFSNFIKSFQFVNIINNNSSDFQINSIFKLFISFVIAVETNLITVKSGFFSSIKLSDGNDVQTDSLVLHNSAHFHAAKRLACIAYKSLAAVEFINAVFITLTVLSYQSFVHDIERRAVLLCKFNSINSAGSQMTFFINSQIFRYKHFQHSFQFGLILQISSESSLAISSIILLTSSTPSKV